MKSMEIVIVGDVIQSRKEFNPKKWDLFHHAIAELNEIFAEYIKIPLTIYSGDSFGGTCLDIKSAVKLVLEIQKRLRAHKSRVIIIEDEISYGLENNEFQILEGEALWKSQALLKKVKKGNTLFVADVQNELKTLAINTIVNLILSIRADWTEIEWKVYGLIENEMSQKELAQKLNVSQQYVSKILRTSKMKLVNDAAVNLSLILDGISNSIHSGK